MDPLRVRDLIEKDFLKLDLITGSSERIIFTTEIYIPGLFLSGKVDDIPDDVILLFTPIECKFIEQMKSHTKLLNRLKDKQIPVFIFSDGCIPPDRFKKVADDLGIPILSTPHNSTRITLLLGDYLRFILARRQKIHGTLVDVYGVGILFKGESGVGKSECALDLVRKGHRLVGDDFIEIIAYPEGKILGRSGAPSPELRFLMELRGVGFIDVLKSFGVASVEETKFVDMVVELKSVEDNPFDRLGFEFEKTQLLGVELPYVRLPVIPGKNISTVVESLALKYLIRKMGKHPEKLIEEIFIDRLKEKDDKETTG